MYTIYVSCIDGDELNKKIKKSSIHYNNNLIYGKSDISISEIRENISESQYIIADISEGNILSGVMIGISLEKGIGIIAIKKEGDEDNMHNYLVDIVKEKITYKDFADAVKKLEDIIQKM